jgi:FkbM family methyltransferase
MAAAPQRLWEADVLKRLQALAGTVRHLVTHPLGRVAPLETLGRWAAWQVGTRLIPGPVVVPFVDDAVLVVARGMTGATGNVYSGLHEFEDMGFVLHFLRPGERFGDIGSNVGSYAVLAAGGVGASGFAVEPIPETARHLARNLAINGLLGQVVLVMSCVGREAGVVRMTADHDTVNRVARPEEPAVEVPMTTLDALAATHGCPTLLKIDVEGFEREVLAGGSQTLADPTLRAVILEVNADAGGAAHTSGLAATLGAAGFVPVRYDPLARALAPRDGGLTATEGPRGANAIFIRDLAEAEARVRAARTYRVGGRRL